jgi:hypothetical protein
MSLESLPDAFGKPLRRLFYTIGKTFFWKKAHFLSATRNFWLNAG